MLGYFKRIQPPDGKLFPGGLAWSDLAGTVRVSTNRSQPGDIANVADRSDFIRAIRSGAPYVSEGLTGRLNHQQVVATGVPTRDDAGKITGVLIGTVLIKPATPSQATFDLGYAGARDHRSQGPVDPRGLRAAGAPGGAGEIRQGGQRRPLRHHGPRRTERARPRLRRDEVPHWTVILDRPRSSVFAAARHTLELEAALLGGVALLDLGLLLWVVRRARAGRGSPPSARCSGGGATSASTRSRRRCSGACSPRCPRSKASTRPRAIRPGARGWRSEATGSTCCTVPTGSS